MRRGWVLTLLLSLAWPALAARQEPGVLRVSVVLTGEGNVATPIRRHLLLISDNPSSAPPRRVFTAADGTVEVRLRPGNYTVESDQPVAFAGRTFQWIQSVDVAAGRETTLALTPANADTVTPPPAAAVARSAVPDEDRASIAARWQDGVVAIWSPSAHASGVVVDAAGLVVTNQQAVGAATSVEVQFSPARKVRGLVVATDAESRIASTATAERDLAVVRIDPATAAAVPVVPLGCGEPAPAPAVGDEVIALEAPLRQPKGAVSGDVTRVATRIIESDLLPGRGGSGGPVFSTRGALLGILSEGDERMRRNAVDVRVVRTPEVCEVVARARAALGATPPPPATALPVEPAKPYPTATLTDAETLLARHAPFQVTSAGFDVTFLTPVHIHGGREQRIATSGRSMQAGAAWLKARLATEFANWDDYVADVPPVLFIRVTPKMVESVWMKIARGAAYTQGVALPAIKRLSSGFSSLTVWCGDREITPIHPFVLGIEVSDTETVNEGLYAFAPDAITPACGSVRLDLRSQKEPAKADILTVDPKVLEQIWADFAVYRAP